MSNELKTPNDVFKIVFTKEIQESQQLYNFRLLKNWQKLLRQNKPIYYKKDLEKTFPKLIKAHKKEIDRKDTLFSFGIPVKKEKRKTYIKPKKAKGNIATGYYW